RRSAAVRAGAQTMRGRAWATGRGRAGRGIWRPPRLPPARPGDLLGRERAPPADDLKHDNAQWQGRDGPLRRAAISRVAMTTANSPAPTEHVTAALLVIGDEILSGRTKDKNIGYIAEYLTALGIDLREVRVVGD